jgi:hypothetical protein
MPRRLSVTAAQQAASEIASRFGLFECDRCAAEIAKRLGRSFPATFERLRTSDKSDVIGLIAEGVQVSRNRAHVGVRVGDQIFDNLHHGGTPASEWAARFMTMTEAPLETESRPIGDFFGRVFLGKKFRQWLFAR